MQKGLEMKLTVMILCGAAAFAQKTESRMPLTDAEKIVDALRAGPLFATKDATLLDWPSTPGGEYRVLRKGSSQWTCLPGLPGSPHDEPVSRDIPSALRLVVEPIVRRESREALEIALRQTANAARASGAADTVRAPPFQLALLPARAVRRLAARSSSRSKYGSLAKRDPRKLCAPFVLC
jgi:hypothetical protein